MSQTSLFVLLVFCVGVTVGFVISNSIEIEVSEEIEVDSVRRVPDDKPTCSHKYEDCIADIQNSMSTTTPDSQISANGTTNSETPEASGSQFQKVILATLNCSKLYLKCRKEMQEAKTTTNSPHNL